MQNSYLQETYKLIFVKSIEKVIYAIKTILTITIENTLIKEERITTKTGKRKTPPTIVLPCLQC
jgi:hypothetical protein